MDASWKSWLPVVIFWSLGCTPVPSKPGHADNTEPVTEDDSGADTDTDTGFPGASIAVPLEDMLPGWSLAWARATGGPGGESAAAIAVSGPDSFVATGHIFLSDELSFNGITIPGSPENMFLVKYNTEGKPLWATWAGDDATVVSLDVDALEDGRIAVGGWCEDGARFGVGEPVEMSVQAGMSNNPVAFVAVYEPDGSLAWVRTLFLVDLLSGPFGTKSRAETMSVKILEDGSVLATGQFDGEVVAGAGTPAQTTLVRDPDGEIFAYNLFLVKYDPDGNLLWARREGGPGRTAGSGLAARPDGSFFLVAGFRGTATLGEGGPSETTLESMGSESVFLASFDHEGYLEWATDLGIDGKQLYQMFRDGNPLLLSNGDVAIPGAFKGTMLAGNGDDVTPVMADLHGLFISRYTANGQRVWTRVVPRVSQGRGTSFLGITETHDGMLVASGGISGNMLFGAGETNETLLAGGSRSNGVLAGYSASGEFLWGLAQGGLGDTFFSSIVRFPDDEPPSDIIITGGGFSQTAVFGTGGGDVVIISAHEPLLGEWGHCLDDCDIILLRFDREAN